MAKRGRHSRLKLSGHRGILRLHQPAAYSWRHCDSQKAISPARTSMDPKGNEAERGGDPSLGLRMVLSALGYRRIASH